MNTLFLILGFSILGFFLALVDTYLPFIPPATTTLAVFIYNTGNAYYFYVLPVGIAMGLGTAVALYGLRRIEGKILEKVQNQKFNKLQQKVTTFVEVIGDYSIIVAHSCGLGTPIAYIYILVDEVNYKTYTLYTMIGRIMLLSLFVATSRLFSNVDLFFIILVICVYVIVYVVFIVLLIVHRKKFKLLKRNKS